MVSQKKIAGVIYGILLLAAAFVLGWFAGNGSNPAQIQVAVAETVQKPVLEEQEITESIAAEPNQDAAGLVDLNTADQLTLETLPGIGPELAARIIAYRQSIGAFVTKEQIMDVSGIGEKRYADIEQLITVGGTP